MKILSVTRHFINIVLSLLPPSRLFVVRRWMLSRAGVDLSIDVCFCGGGWIYGRGELVIGATTWLSPRVIFYTHPDAPISLGDCCDVGPGVEFITGSHTIGGSTRRAGEGCARPIVVGNGCWIGARSIILGGVSIGSGSIVAAGSVVTRDVPENVLVAGVPAQIKKSLSE